MSYVDDIAHDGFAIFEEFLDAGNVSLFLDALANARLETGAENGVYERTKAFGIRNLLNVVPFTRELANSSLCKSLIEPVLGPDARVVRGIYFDKHKDANWKVAWHQDLTIAVRERIDVQGYGPWSLKA
ncbi:MAG TPA: hypothetical protein VGD38_15175, partial [Pyrinomonadaceae bacterium]